MAKKLLEEIAELPAEALEEGIEAFQHGERALFSKRPFRIAEEYWETLGPGLTTGAADDDPSGIATYSQTGAQYGFQLAWLALFTYPFMAVVEEMCARIGLVTGRGLAANIRRHYSERVLMFCTLLLLVANALNLGADLGAMAEALRLIAPVPFALGVVGFAVLSLLLQVFTTYARYSKYLKYLALVLFSYILSALAVNLDWSSLLYHAVVPSLTFSKEQILLVCAILGTTISPYLFFWQTSQEVEEQILAGKTNVEARRADATPRAIRRLRTDVWSGMFLSNIVMFFIIAACGATLYANGITTITTAAEAAQALRPFGGQLAYVLFALGIIGTGMLAVPVLAGSTAYAVAESFGWRHGLYHRLKGAYAFYGVIIISMAIGIALNFVGLNPIQALIYSAVANGLIAPVILFFIVKLSSDRRVMGEHINRPLVTGFGWLITTLMTLAGVAAIASFF